MAILGTRERPAVIRVQEPRRSDAVMRICKARGWQVIVGVEPDKPEDLTDLAYLLAAEHKLPKVGRNDPCPCGSGRKFKKCCEALPSPAARLVDAAVAQLAQAPGLLELVGPFDEPTFPLASDLEALWAWQERQPWQAAEWARAHDEFLGDVQVPRDPERQLALAEIFADWFLLDRPLSAACGPHAGQTPAAAWRPDSALAGTQFAAFVVVAAGPEGVTVRRPGEGADEYRLSEPPEVSVAPGDLLVGRLYPWNGVWLTGSYTSVLSPVDEKGFDPDELESLTAIADARGYAETLGVYGVD